MDNFARLLKESWALVEGNREQMGEYFYARLFRLDPALRQLFPADMAGQGNRHLDAIVTAIQAVDDVESFEEYLRSLGRDHRKYHVDAGHYETAGIALLDALRSTAGDGWNLEYDQAWRDTHATIVERMLAGAEADENPPFWHAEVLTHERYGPDTAVLTVRALQYPLRWRAGQYVSVEAPRHLPRVWRTYSVANAPNDDNVLEFHVRTPPGAGWLSGVLVRRTKPGDLLRVAAPMGSMTVDRASERDILCVAGGVGLAPIKGLIEELTTWNRTRWVHVFYGDRRAEDLYGLPGLRELVAAHPWLSVTPACSQDPDFEGEQGDIAGVVGRYGPWTNHDCYVSGSARVVRSTLRALAGDDVAPPHIRYDTFGEL
ncbi:globin domain-containing protein [Micromonospora olivasterospora]|uniref:nitric oxide dioxygenase n=1 Tax=Micromonospora olivasterospora TaxID=1880 RepID=A0A562I8G9_MICOL|nr:globin domain-containing protein [Micromonospora olivasterospora]TWH67291.1 NAD(P)H-flavin reductase [Micromonospora olivasterospora]